MSQVPETPATCDPISAFAERVDEALREMDKSEVVRHLRQAGAELLRALRCGLDEAIERLEPKAESKG